MTGAGQCNVPGCGGELDDRALLLALEAGPGRRGESAWSVWGTRSERFAVCGACLAGAGAQLLRVILTSPGTHSVRPPRYACAVHCGRPRRRNVVLLDRDRIGNARCPECYGRADVVVAAGAGPVPRLTWWQRIRNHVYPAPPWEPDIPEQRGPLELDVPAWASSGAGDQADEDERGQQ